MSIYNQSMSDLNIADVQELLSEAAIENVRLEFKKEIPGRDEMLKKLSAFANTYGGYLIIGAEADSTTGRILGLPGVDLVPGLKQRVIQWCQEWLWPPISPLVSDPHTLPADPQRACYGIFVEESDEAPHFINARKGAYIRTDELSHRFEPRLATYEELQHLANRRSLAVVRRGQLLERAERRFESYAKMKAASRPATRGPLGATIKLAICPRFPITRLCEQQRLFMLLREQTIPWRGTRFPLLQSGAFLS